MKSDYNMLYDSSLYQDEDKEEFYEDYSPKKMTKKEFIREMLRLQEEKNLFYKE